MADKPSARRWRSLGVAGLAVAVMAALIAVSLFARSSGNGTRTTASASASGPLADAMLSAPRDDVAAQALADTSRELDARIGRALEGVSACLAEHPMSPDVAWLLGEAESLIADPALSELLVAAREQYADHPVGGLLHTQRVRPNHPVGRGLTRGGKELGMTVFDAIYCDGAPSERVRRFVATDGYDGYLLAHQVFVMIWAERRPGCRIPAEWAQRRGELLDRVLAQARATERFGDLYAELLALLALSGRAPEFERAWVDRVLEAQSASGCWSDRSPVVPLEFAGEDVEYKRSIAHTTGLAAYVLARYRADTVGVAEQ